MNYQLKMKIYQFYRTQSDAAMAFGMREDRLSQIVRKRRVPTEDEKKVICELLCASESVLFERSSRI